MSQPRTIDAWPIAARPSSTLLGRRVLGLRRSGRLWSVTEVADGENAVPAAAEVVTLEAWRGRVKDPREPTQVVIADTILGTSPKGGSGSFPVRDEQGQVWFVKPLNNRQGGRVIVSEQIVAGAGRLIGAPVCETTVVELTDDLAGFEFVSGLFVEPGLAHGSASVSSVVEASGAPDHRYRDDNRRRHAGLFALYDWCYGSDEQWLYRETADREIHSHDHGHYFPGSTAWTTNELTNHVDDPHMPTGWSSDGLDSAELLRIANHLDEIGPAELLPVLQAIPESWPASNDDLDAIGYFLELRARPVAERLRAIAGGSA